MAEVVYVFDDTILIEGKAFSAQVVGRPEGHIWEGWIEFVPADGEPLRTRRETTQPDRAALVYWASGLSATYLEGALQRALDPPARRAVAAAAPEPAFASPAPAVTEDGFAADRAILDPFSVAAKGETLLRQELGALRAWHLRNIIRAYRLVDAERDVETLQEPALIELIVAGVQNAERA